MLVSGFKWDGAQTLEVLKGTKERENGCHYFHCFSKRDAPNCSGQKQFCLETSSGTELSEIPRLSLKHVPNKPLL